MGVLDEGRWRVFDVRVVESVGGNGQGRELGE